MTLVSIILFLLNIIVTFPTQISELFFIIMNTKIYIDDTEERILIMKKIITLAFICTLLAGCKASSVNGIGTFINVKYYTEPVTNMNGKCCTSIL